MDLFFWFLIPALRRQRVYLSPVSSTCQVVDRITQWDPISNNKLTNKKADKNESQDQTKSRSIGSVFCFVDH